MPGLPTVTVLLDDGTGTFPYNVTSYVRMVDGITLTAGRGDEMGQAQAGTCSLTFDNTDGRFTLGSTIIDSPSPIVLNQQIRVQLTVSGTTVDRFTGYVQEWPIRWPGGGQEFSSVTITASDALARMGRIPVSAPLAEVMLLDGATLVYPLTDPQPAYTVGNAVPACYPIGSYAETAGPIWAVIKSNEVSSLGFSEAAFASVEMPNGNGSTIGMYDAGTTFGNHPYRLGYFANQSAGLPSGPNVSATSTFTVECAFKVPQATDTTERIANLMWLRDIAGAIGVSLAVSSAPSIDNPRVEFRLDVGASAVTVYAEGDYADAAWHFASMVVTNSGKTITAYLDGALVGSDTAGSSPAGTLDDFRLLYNASLGAGDPVSLGYVGFTPAALTADQIAAHAEVAVGAAGFRTDEVVERYADIAGVPFSALDQGASRVPTFAGSDALSVVNEVMNTERGRLYVNGSGTLTFEPRDYFLTDVYAGTPDISGTGDLLNPDASFSVDPQQLINRAEVTRSGGAPQVREDAASITQNGVYGNQQTIQAMTDSDAANLAAYLIWLYADPSARLAGAQLDLLTQSTATQQAFLVNLMGAWLRLTSIPAQAPASTLDVYIEGLTESISDSAWTLSLNTAPKQETATTWWRLNDANFPLGTNTHPFY